MLGEAQDRADQPLPPNGAASARLEEQLAWYERESAQAKRWFHVLKVGQIFIAASIPVAVAVGAKAWVAAILGAVIVVVESLQQLFQFQQNWVTFRATAEALKHEKYLYTCTAGPYALAQNQQALLAERVEGLVSQEHAAWTSAQRDSGTLAAAGGHGD